MNKNFAFWVFVILIIITVGTSGCVNPNAGPFQFSEEESKEIARQFILNSPTYKFDGSGLVHKESMPELCPSCWGFTFEFKSSHAGYGDRTGQMLAQVITPHTASIAVRQGEVKSAVLDMKWDMIRQEMIEEQK